MYNKNLRLDYDFWNNKGSISFSSSEFSTNYNISSLKDIKVYSKNYHLGKKCEVNDECLDEE